MALLLIERNAPVTTHRYLVYCPDPSELGDMCILRGELIFQMQIASGVFGAEPPPPCRRFGSLTTGGFSGFSDFRRPQIRKIFASGGPKTPLK